MDYSHPGSSVPGTSQATILEWIAISFSRGSSWPRDWTWVSSTAGEFSTTEPPRELANYKLVILNSWLIQFLSWAYELALAKHCLGLPLCDLKPFMLRWFIYQVAVTWWLEISNFNQPRIHKTLTGSGRFIPKSILPLREAETWAWNSASSEVASLSLFLLVLSHPEAMTGLEFSEAHMILVLLERRLKLHYLNIVSKDIQGHTRAQKNTEPTWDIFFSS